MKKVAPYSSLEEAQQALDNGGRWINWFTHAGDEEIAWSELSKAAGAHGATPTALFYDLATRTFDASTRETLELSFTDKVKRLIEDLAIVRMTPGDFTSTGEIGKPITIDGSARKVDEETLITSTMMIPVQVGNITTYSTIPVTARFQVLEIKDESGACRVFAAKDAEFEANRPCRWAGWVEKQNDEEFPHFLRAVFYSELDD